MNEDKFNIIIRKIKKRREEDKAVVRIKYYENCEIIK